jgi:predicted nucleotide-binding protein (sugar kinase/HSP70/actin superfamily)
MVEVLSEIVDKSVSVYAKVMGVIKPKKEAKMLEEQIRDNLPTEVKSKEEEDEGF